MCVAEQSSASLIVPPAPQLREAEAHLRAAIERRRNDARERCPDRRTGAAAGAVDHGVHVEDNRQDRLQLGSAVVPRAARRDRARRPGRVS